MELDLITKRGIPYTPSPTQALWHSSPAIAKCLIGPFGEGKTTPGTMECLIQALEVPNGRGGKGVIFRYDEKVLISTTWADFLAIIPEPIRGLCRIRQRPYPQVFFPNGFEVRGMHMKNFENLGSEEFSFAYIDECNDAEVDEKYYLMLMARRRNPVGRRQILLTGNHGPRNWVWKRFFAHLEDRAHKKYPSHEGFQIKVGENRHNQEDYLPMMYSTYPEEWMQRYLAGDFGVAEGQILTEFNPDIHLVQALPIPDGWARYRGIDPGINHPTVCLWMAQDYEGYSIIYREYVKRGKAPADHAREILAASLPEEEQISWTVIDPAARQRQAAGGIVQSITQQYLEAGLHCHEGDNDVRASIMRLKQMLTPNPDRPFPKWHHMAGQVGSPDLFISTACPYLKWEIEGWRWKALKPGQIDRERVHAENDDAIACARYLIMRSPAPAMVRPVPVSAGERIRTILEQVAAERRGQDQEWVGRDRLAYT